MKDGLFLSDKGPLYKNVSGVLITHVMEFNFPISKYWLIKHPFAKWNLNFEIFDLSYQYVKDGKIMTTAGKSINEVLNIDPDWI